MNIEVKNEPIDNCVGGGDAEDDVGNNIINIKRENESEDEFTWLPTKIEDEELEYYQQFQQYNDDGEEEEEKSFLMHIKPEPECEFSVEYIDEGEGDHDDDECNEDDSDEDEGDFGDTNDYGYKELNNLDNDDSESRENMDESASASCNNKNVYNNNIFGKWLIGDYIQHQCPICQEKFKTYTEWRTHIDDQHQDEINKTKINYFIKDNSRAICKQCNKQFDVDHKMLLHFIRHTSQYGVKMYLCNVCEKIKSSKTSTIQNHIIHQHPHVQQLFTSLEIQPKKGLECPCCALQFQETIGIRYHFMDYHPEEFKEKFNYPCHMCDQKNIFDNEQNYFQHLLEDHNLKDWKLLNFQQISEQPDHGQQYLSCKRCYKIFTHIDLQKLLLHFLEHDAKSRWLCKYCRRKRSFAYYSYYHICPKMFKIFRTNAIKAEESKAAAKKEFGKDATNWHEFEEYIKHMCPFCNKEFDILTKWQVHLRKIHYIDTLQGLEMYPIPGDFNKMQCKLCSTLIANRSVQLHTHRFQHLPYKPYKCRHCSKALSTYKIALAHILNKCQDDFKTKNSLFLNAGNRLIKLVKESVEISCTICNEIYPDEQIIQQHNDVKHNNFIDYFTKQLDNSMVCNICKKKFSKYDRNISAKHFLLHLDRRSFKCLKCSQSFRTNKGCFSHLKKTHFAKSINQEQIRSKSLTNTTKKVVNVQTKAKMAQCSEKSTILNEFVDFIAYACPECNQSLATQQLWHDHISSQHNFFDINELHVPDPLDGSPKCKQCHLKLDNSVSSQQKHKLTHMPHRSFICNLCNHRCNTTGVLYGHLRRLHFKKGAYKCPICPEVSETPYGRSEHLKNIHPRPDWPDNICVICFKVLSSKSSLTSHMIVHDCNRPKFECEYCGTKIVDIKDFRLHTGRHLKALEGVTEAIINNDDRNLSVTTTNHVANETPKTDEGESKIKEIENINKRKTNSKPFEHKKKIKAVDEM